MKNILFINYGENWIRGQETCLITLLRNIDRTNYNPVVICNSTVLDEELSRMGICTFLTKIPEISYDGKKSKVELFSYIGAFFFYRSIIMNYRIDLIYSNSGLPSQLGYPLARWFSIPLITHIHSPHTKRYAWMWLFKFANMVIFVSDATRKSMESKVKFRDTVLIYNGIDTDRFTVASRRNRSLRKLHGVGDDDIVIGQVGSLIYRKGADLLIESFARLVKRYSNVKLIIVGDGPDKNKLHELMLKLGVDDRMRFAGDVKNTEDYYSHLFDINVLASRSESLPLTLLEGAACGLPNIGSRVDGIPEIIEDGINGYLFENENIAQLTEKLSLLIDDENLRKSFGESGRAKIEKKFGVKEYSSKIEDVIDTCLHI